MQKGQAEADKDKGKLSLFTNERHEDLASIIGAAIFILLVIVLV